MRRRKSQNGAFALLLLLASLFSPGILASGSEAVGNVCDPGLLGNLESAHAYKFRGDRCEGVYRLQVSSTHLSLSSLTEFFEPIDVSSPEDLKLGWSVPPSLEDEDLRLRVSGLLPPPGNLYRMDSRIAIRDKPFNWPSTILEGLKFDREDLGVLGWVRLPSSTTTDDDPVLYLPLRVYQNAEPEATGVYEVAFTPKKRLREVYVTVTPVDIHGEPLADPLRDGEPLEYGYYPADQPTFFEISIPGEKGFYEVFISATFEAEGAGSLKFALYHHGGKSQ